MKQLLNKKNLFVLLFLTAVCTILPANVATPNITSFTIVAKISTIENKPLKVDLSLA